MNPVLGVQFVKRWQIINSAIGVRSGQRKFHYATGPKISLDFFIPHLLSQYLLQHLVLITEGPEQGIMPLPDMKKKTHNNNKKPQIKPRLKDWSFRKNERLPPYPSPPSLPPSIYHSIINYLPFPGIAESLPQKNIRRQSRASFGGCILYSQVLIMRF